MGWRRHGFPPGYRYVPTDVELVRALERKLHGLSLPLVSVFHDVNIREFHPKDLAEDYKEDKEDGYIYFFSRREYRNANGNKNRALRTTKDGSWKASGRAEPITSNGIEVGRRQTLVFYEDKNKTDWGMHEYIYTLKHQDSGKLPEISLYRLYVIKGGKKNRENGGGEAAVADAADAGYEQSLNTPSRAGFGESSKRFKGEKEWIVAQEHSAMAEPTMYGALYVGHNSFSVDEPSMAVMPPLFGAVSHGLQTEDYGTFAMPSTGSPVVDQGYGAFAVPLRSIPAVNQGYGEFAVPSTSVPAVDQGYGAFAMPSTSATVVDQRYGASAMPSTSAPVDDQDYRPFAASSTAAPVVDQDYRALAVPPTSAPVVDQVDARLQQQPDGMSASGGGGGDGGCTDSWTLEEIDRLWEAVQLEGRIGLQEMQKKGFRLAKQQVPEEWGVYMEL